MTQDTIQIPLTIPRRKRLRCAYNYSASDPGRKIAAIKFSGQYLEAIGFKHDEWFDLVINDDKTITISPVSKEMIDEATES